MSIDLICLLILAFAAFNGYRKGLISAVVSFTGFFIGLAAAIKLSATVASRFNPGSIWTPFLTFLMVFLISAWLVNLLGRLLHQVADKMMAGPLNRIGGIFMYLLTYLLIISFFLFFAGKTGIIPPHSFSSSIACRYLEPLGRILLDGLGHWIPLFRGLFGQLLDFFEGINKDLTSP